MKACVMVAGGDPAQCDGPDGAFPADQGPAVFDAQNVVGGLEKFGFIAAVRIRSRTGEDAGGVIQVLFRSAAAGGGKRKALFRVGAEKLAVALRFLFKEPGVGKKRLKVPALAAETQEIHTSQAFQKGHGASGEGLGTSGRIENGKLQH